MAIYAGADLFLMPSRSEPCGLSQMIAMRYGTVPIVRETGGLKDTVRPYEAWRDAGNGFTFANYAGSDMLYVIREAVYLYKDYPDAFARLRRRAMESDFSWARSAGEYLHIYSTVTGQPWPPAAAEEPAPAEEGAPQAPAAEEEAPASEETPAGEAAPEEPAPVQEAVPAQEPAASAEPAAPVPEEAAPEKKPPAKRRPAAKKAAAKKPAARKSASKSGKKSPVKKETAPEKGTAGK